MPIITAVNITVDGANLRIRANDSTGLVTQVNIDTTAATRSATLQILDPVAESVISTNTFNPGTTTTVTTTALAYQTVSKQKPDGSFVTQSDRPKFKWLGV